MFDFDTSVWMGEKYTGVYENNRENDSPHFVINTGGTGSAYNAEFADFNIAPLPNVVNQGDPYFPEEYIIPDLYDGPRIRFGRIDFGAYESYTHRDTMPATITQDTVIIADTIHVLGSINIPDGITLKIYAGAKVVFHGYDSMAIRGTIEAIGTQTDPIIFTVMDTTGFAGQNADSGAWKGIVIDNSNGSMSDNKPSIFDHCIFEYVKLHTSLEIDPNRGGALTVLDYNKLTGVCT